MIYLFVSTFGEDTSWIKFPNKISVEVGSSCRDKAHPIKYQMRDNIGKNISDENPYFGELTGLYYIWKNKRFKTDDIVGFTHYNKILYISPRKLNEYVSIQKSWVVREPEIIPAHKYSDDIKVVLEILKEYFPNYYISWNKLYDKDGRSKDNLPTCSASQMFFTSAQEFDKYCNFLFRVLNKVYKRIGKVNRSNYNKRYCAFLGERLLSVYLITNEVNLYYAQTLNRGGTRLGIWLQKIIKKYHISYNSHSFLIKMVKNNLIGSRRSSYK